MPKTRSIDALAAATARQAQSQSAALQRDLRALRDSFSGLTRAIKAPAIKPPRTKTKTTRTTSWLNDALAGANILSGGALSDAGLQVSNSFYISATQRARAQSDTLSLGKRIS